MTEPVAVKVIETPAEKLARVAGLEGAPREVLWEAIASAVIDINERMAVLEADADARRRVISAIEKRVGSRPSAREAVRDRYPHSHACATCSPDGRQPGPGCINCRKTGMDQTPCQAEGHKPQCPNGCCDPNQARPTNEKDN